MYIVKTFYRHNHPDYVEVCKERDYHISAGVLVLDGIWSVQAVFCTTSKARAVKHAESLHPDLSHFYH